MAVRQKPPARGQEAKNAAAKHLDWLIAAGLLLLAAVVYAQVAGFDFTNYDDPAYVPDNANVRGGFSPGGIRWAFTTFDTANWYPLTWLSLMLDCQLFGPRPGAHHAVNAVLHAVNALLLFAVLRAMSGRRWPSAAVAALFAVHPLHVESVAWIAERKDVLATLFFVLTLLAYRRYAARPSLGRWSVVFVGMVLGLLCKPMLVTLPFVLLLLDYWPLARMRQVSLFMLLLEKLPLIVLSVAASAVTVVAQASLGATAMLGGETYLRLRVFNAAVAYVKYLAMTFWPTNLAVFYPYDFHPQPILVGGAILVLILVSAAVLSQVRRAPYAAVGWFWYLGTLVPTIGLVQVGAQSLADRYTYIPSIGLFIAVMWLAADLERWLVIKSVECVEQPGEKKVRSARILSPRNVNRSLGPVRAMHPLRRSVLHAPCVCATFAAVTLAVLLVVAHQQVAYWVDSERLFRHALAVTGDNAESCENLGDTLLRQGRYAEAEEPFRKVLARDAKKCFPQTRCELARALDKQGRYQEAVALLSDVLRADPNDAQAMNELAMILAPRMLNMADAIALLEKAISLNPTQPAAARNLAWIYATCPDRRFRNGPKAVELARRACELSGWSNVSYRLTLADAYLESGDRKRAAAELRGAQSLTPGDGTIAKRLAEIGGAEP